MPKFKIKIDDTAIKQLKARIAKFPKGTVDRRTSDLVGQGVSNRIKSLTKKGISTVRGAGLRSRMTQYAPSYIDRIGRGGGVFRSKRKRPVNLRLTGKFMNSLTFKSVRSNVGFTAEISYRGALSNNKEDGHAVGHNGQARRPTLPGAVTGNKSEKWAKTIEVFILDIYRRRLSLLIKELNKKR